LSGHPLSSVLPQLQPFISSNILTCLEGEEEKKVALGGLVTGFRQNVTKKGEMMASFVLEDLTGGIEVLVFPRVYAQIHALVNDKVIVVVGNYIIRDEEKKIFAEKITTLEDLKPFVENKPISLPKIPKPQTVGKRLWLRFPNDKSELMETITSILQRYPGSQPVYFFFEDNRKYKKEKFWVSDGDELMNALYGVMGQGNVVWKVAKNFA
jgi:DNA polymerase-3 subunit alpha